MITSTQLFLGAPIEVPSERAFLLRLLADLEAEDRPALIFANFFAPPDSSSRQVDFLLVFPDLVCHIELKNLGAPVFGERNGVWELRHPDGSLQPLPGTNPYHQALGTKMALSDTMRAFAQAHFRGCNHRIEKPFYKQFESIVCVFPGLLPESKVPSDFKVRVSGYADLLRFAKTSKKNPGWTQDDWTAFAMHLSVVREEDFDGIRPSITLPEADLVSAYRRRFQDFYSRELAPLVPTSVTVGGEAVASTELLGLLTTGRHAQLCGASGSGKSHLLRHAALQAASAGWLPIFVRAVEYGGRLSSLLDRSVAHLCPQTANKLLAAARNVGSPVVVLIDGYNESPEQHRESLLKDLLSLFLRWHVPVVLTTQEPLQLPAELSGHRHDFCILDGGNRVALLRAHSGSALPENAVALSEPFKSAYELSLAAQCLSDIATCPNRAALFQSYVRRRARDAASAAITTRVLAEIAHLMRTRLAGSIATSEWWRIAEACLAGQGESLTVLKEIEASGLLEIRQGQCSFRHELLQRYFEAVALLRAEASIETAETELKRPRNHSLIEFATGLQTDLHGFRRCLEAAAETDRGVAIACDCLLGRYGEVARRAVDADLRRMLREALDELNEIDVTIDVERSRIVASGTKDRGRYASILIAALVPVLSKGRYFAEVIELLARTDRRCIAVLEERYGSTVAARKSLRSTLFWNLFLLGNGACSLASSSLLRSADHMRHELNADAATRVREVLERPEDNSTSVIYICLCLVLGTGHLPLPSVPRLLKFCWDAGVYHLQLKVLDLVRSIADPEWRTDKTNSAAHEKITTMLDEMNTENLFLSTAVVETMMAYGLTESPVSTDSVQEQLAQILSRASEPAAQEEAFTVVSNIFEDVYQGTYYDAIEGLSPSERAQLLTMAALAAPSYSHTTDWILRELLDHDDPVSLPAFKRFAVSFDADSSFPQGATACFVLGHVGCARLIDKPLSLDVSSDELRAWQYYGEILFWMNRPGLAAAQVQNVCGRIWKRLRTDLAFHAIDPLLRMAHSDAFAELRSGSPVCRLFTDFRQEFRSLLEFGAKHWDQLSWIDKRLPVEIAQRRLVTFIIHSLGQIGTADSVVFLEPFLDDPYHGETAVEAVRQINSGIQTQGFRVLHRYP